MTPYSLRVVGMDPSMSNWGLAIGTLTERGLTVQHLQTLSPVVSESKQVRQNCKDIDRSKQLFDQVHLACRTAQAIFVEVPVGSQNSRAAVSYGICVGLLGAMQAAGLPFFEVTATEVKLAGAGTKTASKKDMIAWAMGRHPEAPWPLHQKKGQALVSESKAEHMADAIAAIHAGIALPAFKQMLALSSARPSLLLAA